MLNPKVDFAAVGELGVRLHQDHRLGGDEGTAGGRAPVGGGRRRGVCAQGLPSGEAPSPGELL